MNAARRRRVIVVLALGVLVGAGGCGGDGRRHAARGSHATRDSFPRDSFLPPIGRPVGPRVDALYAPGSQGAFAWLPDGTFWNGDFEIAFLDSSGTLLAFTDSVWQFGSESNQPRVGLNPSLPAGRRRVDLPDGELDVSAFVPWDGSDADTARWTLLRIMPRPVDAGVNFTLRLAVRSGGGAGHFVHPDAPVADRFRYETTGGRLLRNGRTLALLHAVNRSGERIPRDETPPLEERTAVFDKRVPAFGGETSGHTGWELWLAPVGGAEEDAEPPGLDRPIAALRLETDRAWEAEMAKGASFEPIDDATHVAFIGAARLLVGNRERRNGALRFLGNPFQYRDLYLRDGARVVRALLLLGRPDLAAPALDGLFAFQWPGGALVSQRGQLDGTGQALWALGQYASLGGDPTLVDRLVDPALRAARWIALQREASILRGGPAAGLLPYADPRDNELRRGHLLGNDAWALAGLEALVPILRAHGRSAAADSVAAEAADYRALLVELWDREADRQGRPLPPSIEPGAREWGNWSAAYPCGVYAARDPGAIALDRHARARHFAEGLATYGSADSLHHYLGFDLTHAALLRGDARQVEADLAALLAHAQPDGSGFEVAARADGSFGDNLPPHGTWAAMFVDLVRCTMVDERGDSLVLFAGHVPGSFRASRWLDRAPTTFGPASLQLHPFQGDEPMRLEASLPAPAILHWPGSVAVVLTREGDGEKARTSDGRRFVLPKGRAVWIVTTGSREMPG